ncbi:hypothetical protein SAMN05444747_1296 [Variovorax sp. OV329]|nr:hypothetical protein SAMN05444747_1296 [Variovorax sp. OV329]
MLPAPTPSSPAAQRRSSTAPAGPGLTALQLQILEETRRRHEATIEQTRAAAKTAQEEHEAALKNIQTLASNAVAENAAAVTRIKEVAEKAISAAQDGQKHAEKTLELWSALLVAAGVLLTICLGVAAFFGYREMQGIRERTKEMAEGALNKAQSDLAAKGTRILDKSVKRLKRESGQRFESALTEATAGIATKGDQILSEAISRLEKENAERSQYAALLGINMCGYANLFNAHVTSKRTPENQAVSLIDDELEASLLRMLHGCDEYAKKIPSPRALCWAQSSRAMIYYFRRDYEKALPYQEDACRDIADHARFDHHRNLACIAYLHYQKTRVDRSLDLCIKTLEMMQGYMTTRQALAILKDEDVAAIFADKKELKAALEAIQREEVEG